MQEKQPGREQGLFASPERQGLEWFLRYEAVPKAWFVGKWLWFVEKWVVVYGEMGCGCPQSTGRTERCPDPLML